MTVFSGVCFMIFGAFGIIINSLHYFYQRKYESTLRRETPETAEAYLVPSAPLKEYYVSMLLAAVGLFSLGAYLFFGKNLSFGNIAGAFLIFIGYGATIQSFRVYDTSAEVSKRGGDYEEYQKTVRFSRTIGVMLVALGVYLVFW